MAMTFSGEIYEWRGPAPHHFVDVPEAEAEVIHDLASEVTYGWGMIPVTVRMGSTTWTTSLFPKEGGYVVPMKVAVRRKERVDDGDVVTVSLTVEPRHQGR